MKTLEDFGKTYKNLFKLEKVKVHGKVKKVKLKCVVCDQKWEARGEEQQMSLMERMDIIKHINSCGETQGREKQ